MHPKDDVLSIEAGREWYEGGLGPVKYVGASERSPIEPSRCMCAAVDRQVLSPLLVLRPRRACVRRSMLLSASLVLVLVEPP